MKKTKKLPLTAVFEQSHQPLSIALVVADAAAPAVAAAVVAAAVAVFVAVGGVVVLDFCCW